ncbi:hypothetical protein EGW08_020181, partial [Elysia chlorotica]
VIYPEGCRDSKHRSDSLIYLDPPQLASLESGNQGQLNQFEQEQQTQLQQGARLSLPPSTTDLLPWQQQQQQQQLQQQKQQGARISLPSSTTDLLPWQQQQEHEHHHHHHHHQQQQQQQHHQQQQGHPSLETSLTQLKVAQGDQQDWRLSRSPECDQLNVPQDQVIPHGFDKCRNRSEFEDLLQMYVSPLNSTQYYRQPQQQDENSVPHVDKIHRQQYYHHQQQQRQQQSQQQNIPQHHILGLHNLPIQGSQISHNFQYQQNEGELIQPNIRPRTDTNVHQHLLQQLTHQHEHHHHHHHHHHDHHQQHQPHPVISPMARQGSGSSYPHLPPYFVQFNPASHPGICPHLPISYTNSPIFTRAFQNSDSVSNNTRAVPVDNQTAQLSDKRNMTYQKLKMLRPEIIQFDHLFVDSQSVPSVSQLGRAVTSMGSTGSTNSDSSSGSGSRHDAGMMRSGAVRLANTVLSEDNERSSQNGVSSFLLSPVKPNSSRLSPNNKVLRSKSLNYQPNQREDSNDDSITEQKAIIAGRNSEARKQKSLSTFVPSGPPLLSVLPGSLEVEPPSFSSLGSLRSSPAICGSPKRLSRSASSSPSAAIEASGCSFKPAALQCGHESTLIGFQRGDTMLAQPQVKSCVGDTLNSQGVDLCRRCSVDDDILKDRPDISGTGCCRRFSVAGISSVNSSGNIANVASSSSPCSIGSSVSSGEVSSVSREHSCNESAYGSSETSLVSSASDSSGYVHGRTSISDSATDLSCDRDMDALRSWQDLSSLVSPLVSEATSPDPDCRNVDTGSRSPAPRPRMVARFNSVPNYSTTGSTSNHQHSIGITEKKEYISENLRGPSYVRLGENQSEKTSNLISQLNDLSIPSSPQRPSVSAPSSLLFDKHQSLTPMMTCVNIPIN